MGSRPCISTTTKQRNVASSLRRRGPRGQVQPLAVEPAVGIDVGNPRRLCGALAVGRIEFAGLGERVQRRAGKPADARRSCQYMHGGGMRLSSTIRSASSSARAAKALWPAFQWCAVSWPRFAYPRTSPPSAAGVSFPAITCPWSSAAAPELDREGHGAPGDFRALRYRGLGGGALDVPLEAGPAAPRGFLRARPAPWPRPASNSRIPCSRPAESPCAKGPPFCQPDCVRARRRLLPRTASCAMSVRPMGGSVPAVNSRSVASRVANLSSSRPASSTGLAAIRAATVRRRRRPRWFPARGNSATGCRVRPRRVAHSAPGTTRSRRRDRTGEQQQAGDRRPRWLATHGGPPPKWGVKRRSRSRMGGARGCRAEAMLTRATGRVQQFPGPREIGDRRRRRSSVIGAEAAGRPAVPSQQTRRRA